MVKVATADELAHETSVIYLRKIDTAYRHRLKVRVHSGNIRGVQEDFEPTPFGVMWYYTTDKKPHKFIPNDLCNELPKMIREKEHLMKLLKKQYPGMATRK